MCVNPCGFMFERLSMLHVYILPTMLTELLYPSMQVCHTSPLHYAAGGGHTTCVERLLSTPGIDVNIKNMVSWYRCTRGSMEGTRLNVAMLIHVV